LQRKNLAKPSRLLRFLPVAIASPGGPHGLRAMAIGDNIQIL
jgi:hypothetical protein